jgi:hypothetical protein
MTFSPHGHNYAAGKKGLFSRPEFSSAAGVAKAYGVVIAATN